MKIDDLSKVQECINQLKQVRNNMSLWTPDSIVNVPLTILFRQDVYVDNSDVVQKISDLLKDHLKKQEQEIIKKLLELGVTVENEN